MTHHNPLPEMPCRDVVEVVTLYLEDALSADDRRRFEAHMAICDPCVMYVDQVRATIQLAGTTFTADELPAELRTGLRDAFRNWSTST